MAMCEKCSTGSFRPQDMTIESNMFIGPCCSTRERIPEVAITPSELDAGIAITTRRGLQAYAKFEGFEVRLEKSIEEINQWFHGTQVQNQKIQKI